MQRHPGLALSDEQNFEGLVTEACGRGFCASCELLDSFAIALGNQFLDLRISGRFREALTEKLSFDRCHRRTCACIEGGKGE